MARIDYPTVDQIDGGTAALLAKLPPLNIFRMLATSGDLMRSFVRLGNHLLYESSVDPVLREIAIVRVGVLSGASYEVHQHERIAKAVGATDELIAAIHAGPDAPALDEPQRLVMRFTDDVVANVRAGDGVFTAAVALLGEQGVVELTVTIGYYMMVSRFLETFDVDIEGA